MVKREAETGVDWASVEDALDIVRSTKSNLLVIGPDWLVADVVRWVIADAPYSIIVSPREAGRLPALPLPGCTLVLRDIDELDANGQAALCTWLERANGEQQIVCTASGLLPSLIRSGEFDSQLYYRLNIVCINLSEP
jgi:hypothetical protein